jgi:hypothetical protein
MTLQFSQAVLLALKRGSQFKVMNFKSALSTESSGEYLVTKNSN